MAIAIKQEPLDLKPEIVETGPIELKCSGCGRLYISQTFFSKHIKDCPILNGEPSDQLTPKTEETENPQNDGDKLFICSHCPYKTLGKKYLFLRHMKRQHTPDDKTTWFYCEIDDCSYKTNLKYNLKKHQINKHRTDYELKWLECEKCDYRTIHKNALDSHRINRHTLDHEITWFKCDKCGYRTKHQTIFKRHQTDHENGQYMDRWFYCDHCDYHTQLAFNFKKHVSMKHGDKVEVDAKQEFNGEPNLYECHECGYKTKSRGTLCRHLMLKH